MATIKDVAKEAGVGLGTVSRALSGNGSVKPATREKIYEAARKLDFVPNQLALNFKKQAANCVAIMIPTVVHPFFAKMVYYCEEELYRLGYRLIVVNSQDNLGKETKMLEMIRQQRVDGIIFITHYKHEDIEANMPIVSVDRHIGSGIPYLTSDNYAASRAAVKRLIEQGAKNIGCVCGDTSVESETNYRFKAYTDTMTEYRLPIRLFKKVFLHGQEMDVLREFFTLYPDVDGLFAGSDMLASAAYHVAGQRGVRVPDDLQIIGFDGVLDAWDTHPKLTTVVQDIPRMAKAAVEILMCRIRKETTPLRVEIPSVYRVGETTK